MRGCFFHTQETQEVYSIRATKIHHIIDIQSCCYLRGNALK